MSVMENYLYEVSNHLPEEGKQDILDELQNSIEEHWEDAREQLGRDLTLKEQAESLKTFGHPVKIANNYRKQQYLIGPEIFPLFKQVLMWALVGVFALQITIAVTMSFLIEDWSFGIGSVVFGFFDTALLVAAIVLGSFIAAEYYGEKFEWFNNWNTQFLLGHQRVRISRQDMITNVITEGVFLLWWNDLLSFSWSASQELGFGIQLAEQWQTMFWPINLVIAFSFVNHITLLICNHWKKTLLIIELLLDASFILVLVYLLMGNAQVVISKIPGEQISPLAEVLNNIILGTVSVVLAIVLYDTWKHIRVFKVIAKQ